MLKGYEMLSNGVIKQTDNTPITYDKSYIQNSYNVYGEKTRNMSYMRFGFIVGSVPQKIKSICDIGYGNGDFLNVCKEYIEDCYGYDITGYELDPKIKIVKNFDDICADVVTFFDSLEHFENIDFIKDLKAKYVCVSLPSCNYPMEDAWFDTWKHRRYNEHIYHFNTESLIKFFAENGYKVLKANNIEDVIRKDPNNKPNIITAIFEKNESI